MGVTEKNAHTINKKSQTAQEMYVLGLYVAIICS